MPRILCLPLTDDQLDKVATKIITGLEKVESNLKDVGIRFLHVDVDEVPGVSVSSVPSLVYFRGGGGANGEPVPYQENLMNEERIQTWALDEFKANQDVIESMSAEQVLATVKENDFVLVFLCETRP